MTDARAAPRLLADDLVTDRALIKGDRDTLGHEQIAARVAELIEASPTPTNVALFGPWGAGKSSFANLLDRELEKRGKAKLVVYGAWTFAGESLQRNLISTAAIQLNLDAKNYPKFHTGLYEKTQSTRLELTKRQALWFAGRFLVFLVVAVIALALGVAALAWVLGHPDPLASTLFTISALLPATAVVALLGNFAREIAAGARVQVDISPPTQEQFRLTFRKLVEKGRGAHERLVFFVDELDRCRPTQVVEVLAAIRHFYDEDRCVFIVAADREVLEEALRVHGTQSNPVNTENPYYSSASEYIDKVFQHQLELPPLRVRRVTKFALDLVADKQSGLWAELAAKDDGRLRDDVLFVLLPSHVQSPRRAKVLLNNFATTYRMAESRGLDATGNALALAKLTALRTEFPRFAPDLLLEPRLIDMLLDGDFEPTSQRQKELVDRHALPLEDDLPAELPAPASPTQPAPATAPSTTTPAAALDGQSTTNQPVLASPVEPSTEATDVSLVRADAEKHEKLRRQQRRLLHRYLLRTRQYSNPTRALMYLEPAGAAAGIVDAAFGDLLETEVLERPQAVVTAAKAQPRDEQLKAMGLLADMAIQEFGQERANVLDAVLGISHHLQHDLGSMAALVGGMLEVQIRSRRIAKSQLAPALAIALRSEQSDLANRLMADPRLLEDREGVVATALSAAEWMSRAERAGLWRHVLDLYPNEPEVVDELFRSLPENVASDLIKTLSLPAGKRLGDVIRTRLNSLPSDEAEKEADALLSSLGDRAGRGAVLRGELLLRLVNDSQQGNSYGTVKRHAADLESLDAGSRIRVGTGLRGLERGPSADWQIWEPHLALTRTRFDDHDERVGKAIVSVLNKWGDDPKQAALLLRRLVPLLTEAHDSKLESKLRTPIATAVGATTWWDASNTAEAQIQLYRLLFELAPAGTQTRAAISAAVRADLERSLAAASTDAGLGAVTDVAALLEPEDLHDVGQRLTALASAAPPLAPWLSARLRVARASRDKGASPATDVVSASELLPMAGTPGWQESLDDWLQLDPSFDEGLAVVTDRARSADRVERQALAMWAGRRTAEQRTALAVRLVDSVLDASDWIEDLPEDFDEDEVTSEIATRIRRTTLQPARLAGARTIATLRPSSAAAQRKIAELFIWLLEDDRPKSDGEVAKALLPGSGASIKWVPTSHAATSSCLCATATLLGHSPRPCARHRRLPRRRTAAASRRANSLAGHRVQRHVRELERGLFCDLGTVTHKFSRVLRASS